MKRAHTSSQMASQRTSTTAVDEIEQAIHVDSIENGLNFFANLLKGISVETFMGTYWEKAPFCISRSKSDFYDCLGVSTATIDEMLRKNVVDFTKNIDITSYENGERLTHNPDGRALPGTVWEYYNDGCSVRLLNPQTFIPRLHRFNATLQEYFHCLVGANVYLTPSNSQGFAPHYDDIEAFVLQIEGKKRWRLYAPRSDNEKLPRESSGNFKEDEIGDVVLEKTLEPGDLLYFPRGWIHQANTVPGHHSLHITLSVYQKTSYADLFEELTKNALKNAIETNSSYRYGVPLDIWQKFGASHSDTHSDRREYMKNHIKLLFNHLVDYMDLDDAVDRMAIKFQHDALPPYLNHEEKKRTTFGIQTAPRRDGTIIKPELTERTEIRLLRANIVRLINTDNVPQLYYYADNSKEYHEYELNFIELDDSAVDVAKKLIQAYPAYLTARDLATNSNAQAVDEAMITAQALWDRGLLMAKEPLPVTE